MHNLEIPTKVAHLYKVQQPGSELASFKLLSHAVELSRRALG